MGSLQAQEMAQFASLDQGLTWHLTGNHYPPVPLSMVEPCKAAIFAYVEGDPEARIELPGEITWRGEKKAPASAIIEAHHLWEFVNAAVDGEIE